jgi:hypothetical protein
MARTRQTPAAATVLPVLPPVPGWARSDAPVTDADADSGAAFQAGAALAMLDCRVRAGVPFAGAWRRRLALKAAAASARIARRGEDEAMLRDAFLLRHGGDDPGPAGRMLVAWRGLDRSAPVADPAQSGRCPARGDRRGATARRLGPGRSVRGRAGGAGRGAAAARCRDSGAVRLSEELCPKRKMRTTETMLTLTV